MAAQISNRLVPFDDPGAAIDVRVVAVLPENQRIPIQLGSTDIANISPEPFHIVISEDPEVEFDQAIPFRGNRILVHNKLNVEVMFQRFPDTGGNCRHPLVANTSRGFKAGFSKVVLKWVERVQINGKHTLAKPPPEDPNYDAVLVALANMNI